MKVQYQFENISSSKLCQLFVQCCQTSARWEGGGHLNQDKDLREFLCLTAKTVKNCVI